MIIPALIIATHIVAASPSRRATYSTWNNREAHYRIDIPEGVLHRTSGPAHGVGREYGSRDGDISVSVFTVSSSSGKSSAQECDEQIAKMPSEFTTTYRRVTPTWFVFSSRSDKSGVITYEKVLRGRGKRDVLTISYTAEAKPWFDPMLIRMSRSFVRVGD